MAVDLSNATFEDIDTSDESTDSPSRTRSRRRRSDAGKPRSTAKPTDTSKLAADLLDPVAKLATGLAMVSPTVSAVLIERGESTANALVAIAQGHPRMLAALSRVSKVGPGSELVETFVMVVIAFQLDRGAMPPQHPLAAVTGVGNLYAQMHPEPAGAGDPTVFEPPPGFGDNVAPLVNDPRHPMFAFQAGNSAANRADTG